jgi:hypothetical protein
MEHSPACESQLYETQRTSSQATVLGLTALCNRCLGEPGWQPRSAQLLHQYYTAWLENHDRASEAGPAFAAHQR